MPKRKKHSAKRRHYSKHTTHRRRRRMSAGRGAAGFLANPIVGGIVGGLAGMVVTKFAKKANLPGGDMTGAAVPVVAAFFLRKKFPALAAGMASGAGVALLAPKIPFLNEGESLQAYFADPEVLSADGEPLQISDGELSEMLQDSMLSDAMLSDYGQVHNATI